MKEFEGKRSARFVSWFGQDTLAWGVLLAAAMSAAGALYGLGTILLGAAPAFIPHLVIHAMACATLLVVARSRVLALRTQEVMRKTLEDTVNELRKVQEHGDSESRQALLAAERSERFLKALIDAMPNPVWVKDEKHRWVLMNDAFAARLKVTPASLMGKSDTDFYSPELAQRSWREDDEALASERPIVIEERSRFGTDDAKWWLKTKYAFALSDGTRYVAGFAIDITHLKTVEQSVRDSEARFRSLTQLSSDWFWEQDINHRFTFLSSGVIRRGIDPQTYLGKTRWEVSPAPEDDPEWRRHHAALQAQRPYFNLRFRAPTVTGETRLISVNGEPVFDGDGNFMGYRGVARDVSDVTRAEMALRASEERLRAVFETVADGIVVIDDQGTMQSVNPAICRIFDFAAGELLQRNVTLLMPERFRRMHEDGLRNYRGREHSKVIGQLLRMAGRRRDGSEFPLEITITDLTVDGRLLFAGTIRDITEITLAEVELNRQRDYLCELLREKTAKVARAQYSSQDMVLLVRKVVDEVEGWARQRSMGIGIECKDGVAPVWCDPNRIGQVLQNLLSNALKFSPSGSNVTIRIGPAHLPEGRRSGDLEVVKAVEVAVIDSGMGIPNGELEWVFDKFIQSSTTSSGTRGAGLGLPICQAIVRQHAGYIAAAHNPGGGAIFTFAIPAVPVWPGSPVKVGSARVG